MTVPAVAPFRGAVTGMRQSRARRVVQPARLADPDTPLEVLAS